LDIAASHGPASLGKRQSTTKWKIQSSEIITIVQKVLLVEETGRPEKTTDLSQVTDNFFT
jgi:hypothetical protein